MTPTPTPQRPDAREQVLDEDAQVGNTLFRKGVAWSTVIGRAIRERQYRKKYPNFFGPLPAAPAVAPASAVAWVAYNPAIGGIGEAWVHKDKPKRELPRDWKWIPAFDAALAAPSDAQELDLNGTPAPANVNSWLTGGPENKQPAQAVTDDLIKRAAFYGWQHSSWTWEAVAIGCEEAAPEYGFREIPVERARSAQVAERDDELTPIAMERLREIYGSSPPSAGNAAEADIASAVVDLISPLLDKGGALGAPDWAIKVAHAAMFWNDPKKGRGRSDGRSIYRQTESGLARG